MHFEYGGAAWVHHALRHFYVVGRYAVVLLDERDLGGVDGGFDFGIDGGTVCTWAADHAGYEPDVLGDGSDGLFGGGGVGWGLKC